MKEILKDIIVLVIGIIGGFTGGYKIAIHKKKVNSAQKQKSGDNSIQTMIGGNNNG